MRVKEVAVRMLWVHHVRIACASIDDALFCNIPSGGAFAMDGIGVTDLRQKEYKEQTEKSKAVAASLHGLTSEVKELRKRIAHVSTNYQLR